MSALRRTWEPTSTTIIPRAGTTSPWKSWGTVAPSSVVKDRSTMASPGNGLNSSMCSVSSRSVEPDAKYQRSDAAVAQGVASSPLGPLTTCSTTPTPPWKSTKAAASDAWTRSASRTLVRDRGTTLTCLLAGCPVLGTTVTVASNGTSPGLATTMEPSAGPPLAPAPGQYQDALRAVAGGATGIPAVRAVDTRTGRFGR